MGAALGKTGFMATPAAMADASVCKAGRGGLIMMLAAHTAVTEIPNIPSKKKTARVYSQRRWVESSKIICLDIMSLSIRIPVCPPRPLCIVSMRLNSVAV
jgi:hypothetical protein